MNKFRDIKSTSTDSITISEPKIVKVIGTEFLNVREVGNTNARIICVIEKGDELKLNNPLAKDEDWISVTTASGLQGFVMSDYISE